jgi:hypothetical protein
MRSRGLIIITLFDTMNLSDTALWAEEYNLTYPVIIDPLGEIADRFEENAAVPSYTLLAPGMEVVFRDHSTISEADIEPYLQ